MTCRRSGCQALLPEGGRFCPRCGVDQLPDRAAPDMEECEHEFDLDCNYCPLCGFESDPPLGLQYAQRRWIGLGMMVGALLVLVVGMMLLATARDRMMAGDPSLRRVSPRIGGLGMALLGLVGFGGLGYGFVLFTDLRPDRPPRWG